MREMEPGSVIYAFSSDQDVLIEFLVREESRLIAELPAGVGVHLRSGAIWHKGVLVVAVLLAVDPTVRIYPTFWNFWHPIENPQDGNIFQHMAKETELVIKWFGDNGKVERLMPVANPLREFFESCMREVADSPAWEMDQFEEAVGILLEPEEALPNLWKQL